MQRTAQEHGWVRARVPGVAAAIATFVGLMFSAGCYDTGDGRPPPLDAFYFPTGLEVSRGGSVLYVVNSDFDLQYNGGTLQSYDLLRVREHAARSAINPNDPAIPRVFPRERVQGRVQRVQGTRR